MDASISNGIAYEDVQDLDGFSPPDLHQALEIFSILCIRNCAEAAYKEDLLPERPEVMSSSSVIEIVLPYSI
jgi:hypothetical protein